MGLGNLAKSDFKMGAKRQSTETDTSMEEFTQRFGHNLGTFKASSLSKPTLVPQKRR